MHKDLRLAKHPTFKEAVPKTEVLEQPQTYESLREDPGREESGIVFLSRRIICFSSGRGKVYYPALRAESFIFKYVFN
jgi:hypothetical protein